MIDGLLIAKNYLDGLLCEEGIVLYEGPPRATQATLSGADRYGMHSGKVIPD